MAKVLFPPVSIASPKLRADAVSSVARKGDGSEERMSVTRMIVGLLTAQV
jgi:hypothetical protein